MTIDADFESAMDVLRPDAEPLDRRRVLSSVLARLGTGGTGPVVVGRYELGRRLGRGGNGVVWAARDPALDRFVAIKLVAPPARERSTDAPMSNERLRREARVLASVEHPNVARVFDVGASPDGVFVVMELIEGVDVATWLRQKRDWRTVVAVFQQAGRGLASVHAQGLVHHDFKPANVMLADDGAVKVVDFGIASILPPTITGERAEHGANPTSTDHGATSHRVRGTPAYMAPERMQGQRGDAASDQFSLCVSLFEALSGRRPERGRATESAWPSEIPRSLYDVLQRGLQPRPDDRWPSVDALVDALAGPPPRRRAARWGLAAVGLGGVASFAALSWPSGGTDACASAPAIWSAEARASLVDKLQASNVDDAAAQRGLASIDAFASDWAATREQACRASATAHADPSDVVPCLDRLRARLDTLVDVLLAPEPLTYAPWGAVIGLPSPQQCTDGSSSIPWPATPGDRDAAAAIRQRLAAAHALVDGGRAKDARDVVDALQPDATALGFRPVEAELAFLRGWIAVQSRDLDVAVSRLEDSVHLGSQAGYDRIVARAATKLTFVVGKLRANPDAALEWAGHARAAVERLGTPVELEAELVSAVGRTRLSKGELELAQTDLELALRRQAQAYGDADVKLAPTLTSLGMALQGRGRYTEALAQHRRAVGLFDEQGPLHPDLPGAVAGMATTHMLMDDLDAAREAFERAVELSERIHGPNHAFASPLWANLATVQWRQGRLHDAEQGYRRALAIETATQDAHPAVVASIHANIAALRANGGDDAQAQEHYRSAIRMFEAQGGPCSPSFAGTLLGLGGALTRTGKTDEAKATLQRALTCAKGLGPDHPYQARVLLALGELEMDLGRPRKAIELARDALRISERHDVVAGALSRAKFLLATASWEAGVDRRRALELAREVDREYAAQPPVRAAEADQVRDWLEAHRG